jgi:hypothetical protein
MFDHLLKLLPSVERIEIESFDRRSSFMKLRRVIGWWRKLLEHLAPHACGRLLHAYDGTIAEVRLNKEDHLLVSHEYIIAADIVQPALY